jgi:hypothetical protein
VKGRVGRRRRAKNKGARKRVKAYLHQNSHNILVFSRFALPAIPDDRLEQVSDLCTRAVPAFESGEGQVREEEGEGVDPALELVVQVGNACVVLSEVAADVLAHQAARRCQDGQVVHFLEHVNLVRKE